MDYSQSQQITAGVVGSRLGRSTEAPTQPALVQVAQSNLDSCIATLHEALSALEDRLQPVLTMLPEKQVGAGSPVRPVASTVSQRINDSAENVGHLTSRVQRLLDRLEV